jgi:hypothetical protein
MKKRYGIASDTSGVEMPNGMNNLLRHTGFPKSTFQTFQSERDAIQHMSKQVGPGTSKIFGLGYPHQNRNDGHFVALKAFRENKPGTPLKTRIIDFQQPKETRFKTKPDGKEYHLFNPGEKSKNTFMDWSTK